MNREKQENRLFPLGRLISGGQTGVDRAALDFALSKGIPCAGWCPAGRRSESGPIPSRYPLRETDSVIYPQRTRWNIRDSDATLVFCKGEPAGGTALTIRLAIRLRRPFLVIDLAGASIVQAGRKLRNWLWTTTRPRILNVAGPRGSERPDLARKVVTVLKLAITPQPPGEAPQIWPPERSPPPAQLSLFGVDSS